MYAVVASMYVFSSAKVSTHVCNVAFNMKEDVKVNCLLSVSLHIAFNTKQWRRPIQYTRLSRHWLMASIISRGSVQCSATSNRAYTNTNRATLCTFVLLTVLPYIACNFKADGHRNQAISSYICYTGYFRYSV